MQTQAEIYKAQNSPEKVTLLKFWWSFYLKNYDKGFI